MSRVRVNAFAISIDGFGAGPGQDLDNPMGVGGMAPAPGDLLCAALAACADSAVRMVADVR